MLVRLQENKRVDWDLSDIDFTELCIKTKEEEVKMAIDYNPIKDLIYKDLQEDLKISIYTGHNTLTVGISLDGLIIDSKSIANNNDNDNDSRFKKLEDELRFKELETEFRAKFKKLEDDLLDQELNNLGD